MNRTQLACYGLLVSALILGGMLITQTGNLYEQKAEAAQVIARDNFTLLTAKSRNAEEALWVLDNASGQLMIYSFDIASNRIDMITTQNVGRIFSRFNSTGGGAGGSSSSDRGRTR